MRMQINAITVPYPHYGVQWDVCRLQLDESSPTLIEGCTGQTCTLSRSEQQGCKTLIVYMEYDVMDWFFYFA